MNVEAIREFSRSQTNSRIFGIVTVETDVFTALPVARHVVRYFIVTQKIINFLDTYSSFHDIVF